MTTVCDRKKATKTDKQSKHIIRGNMSYIWQSRLMKVNHMVKLDNYYKYYLKPVSNNLRLIPTGKQKDAWLQMEPQLS